jgi:PAS domain S-box-containing protein
MVKKRILDLINHDHNNAPHLLAAIEATLDGIGIVDKNGNLTYMNRALRDLHGIPEDKADDFIGQPWTMLYTDKGRRDVEEKVFPILEKEGYWRGESPIVRQDGTVITAELSLTSFADGGFVGTARDVTERYRVEQEKKELRDNFYQAQKMEAIGRLAGGIAHDFNNILAAMNGYAEFLIDDLKDGSPQHKFAQNILQAGQQAKALVDQMLAFSRRKQSALEVVDLSSPVFESLSMLKATLPKTIDVQTNIEVPHIPVSCNAGQVGQVIMNLCVNAKDAMKNDRGTLSIGLKIVKPADYEIADFVRDALPLANIEPAIRIEDVTPGRTRLTLGHISRHNEYASLSVSDTGTGISRIIMEHIFEPFFTTKPVDEGTGLGLSTVHGVVVAHHAAMIVDSTVGQGSRFEVLFPLLHGAGPAIRKETEDDSFDTGTGNILLVEDQENVRDMMMNMLQRLGYEVKACVTGLEALDLLRENPDHFDLVITDHNMPKMTGLELVQQVSYDLPEMPFILLSGYSQQKLQDLMKEQTSIKAILRKPVSKAALSQKISAVIGERKAAT